MSYDAMLDITVSAVSRWIPDSIRAYKYNKSSVEGGCCSSMSLVSKGAHDLRINGRTTSAPPTLSGLADAGEHLLKPRQRGIKSLSTLDALELNRAQLVAALLVLAHTPRHPLQSALHLTRSLCSALWSP